MPLLGRKKTVFTGRSWENKCPQLPKWHGTLAEVPSDDMDSVMAVSLKKLSPQIQNRLEPQFSLGLFYKAMKLLLSV